MTALNHTDPPLLQPHTRAPSDNVFVYTQSNIYENIITKPRFYDSALSIVHWNINGFISNDPLRSNIKQCSLDYLDLDLQPDILCIQEGRTHYFGSERRDLSVSFTAPLLDNYVSVPDPLLKNVIYVHRRNQRSLQRVDIPARLHNTTILDAEYHHWATWIILTPTTHSRFDVPILICAYYKSPKLARDVENLGVELSFILDNHSHLNIRHIVVCGDFNTHHPAWSLSNRPQSIPSTAHAEYDALSDILQKHRLNLLNTADVPTRSRPVSGRDPETAVLDLTFASDELLRNYSLWQTLPLRGSDHFAVLCAFELTAQHTVQHEGPSPQHRCAHPYKWNFSDPIDEDQFVRRVRLRTEQLHCAYGHCKAPCSQREIDAIGYEFRQIMHESALRYIGTCKSIKHRGRKVWATEDSIIACKKTRRAYRRWQRTRKPRFRRIYKALLQRRRCAIRTAKKQYLDKLGAQLNKFNDTTWWRTVNKLNAFGVQRTADIPFLVRNGERVLNDRTKANIFNNMYCHAHHDCDDLPYDTPDALDFADIPTLPPTLYPTHDTKAANHIRNPKLYRDAMLQQNLTALNAPVSADEIVMAMSTFSSNKNHGFGIHTKLLSLVLHHVLPFLIWFINLCLLAGHFANVYKVAMITPVCKPGRDEHAFESYRQITLTGVMRKLVERIIMVRLLIYVVDGDLIHTHSMGGLKQKSPIDALVYLIDDVYKAWNHHLPTYSVYMDVKSCYPTIEHDLLIARLHDYYAIEGPLLNLIADLLQNTWTQTVVNGTGSRWMMSFSGLGQGRVNSQLLNLLFLDPLFYVLHRPECFRLMLYVDDIALWTCLRRSMTNVIVSWLQQEVDAVLDWLELNNMSASARKTECQVFAGQHIINAYPERIANMVIRTRDKDGRVYSHLPRSVVKYLGYDLSADLSLTVCTNRVIQKTAAALRSVRKAFRRVQNVLVVSYTRIVKSIVLSVLNYFGVFLDCVNRSRNSAMSTTHLSGLQSMYRQVLRYMVAAPHSVPITLLYMLADMPSLADWIQSQQATFWSRLLHIPRTNPLYKRIDNDWMFHWRTPSLYRRKLHTYSRRSPLWRCFLHAQSFGIPTKIKLEPDTILHDFYRAPACARTMPCKPQTLHFLTRPYSTDQPHNRNTHALFCWSDGSLMRAVGGCGFYVETHVLTATAWRSNLWIDGSQHMGESYDICYLELWAADIALRKIASAPAQLLQPYSRVYLTIDNKPVVHWIAGIWKADQPYIHSLLTSIYRTVRALHDNAQISCTVQWCRRGLWFGNDMADRLAKQAVRNAVPVGLIPRTYKPLSHGIIKTLVKAQLPQRRRRVFVAEKNRHLISRNFFQWNVLQTGTFRPKHDHKMLTRTQLAIITRLRTGHSKLNFSNHLLQHHSEYKNRWRQCNGQFGALQLISCAAACCTDNNSGMCRACSTPETEEHFLLLCPAHDDLRRRFIYKYLPLYNALSEPLTLQSLLFPPSSIRWKHRKMILRSICLYAIETGRFGRHY